MDAITLLVEGTMKAVVSILLKDRTKEEIDPERVSLVIKETIKAKLDKILQEWEEATNANIGESWLKTLLNAQCLELAILVVERIKKNE